MGNPITQLLMAWRGGNTAARDELMAMLYPELRRLAALQFRRERANHTLQPTALVNEAWLRLSGAAPLDVADRRQLFGTAARLMRQILVDHARSRSAVKRDGGERVTLSALEQVEQPEAELDLLALDQALDRLEALDAHKARIVELRYFEGLSIEETAQVLDQSPATVKRHWRAARAWLFDALAEPLPSRASP